MLKKLYSPGSFDALFGIVGVICVLGLYTYSSLPAPAVAAAIDPARKSLTMLAVFLVATILATLSNRLDQRLADDFVFHTLTKSAMIGMFSLIFALAGWELLFRETLGEIPSQAMLPLVLAGWSLGYFYTRFRGTRA